MLRHQALTPREHHLLHAPGLDGRRRARHGTTPLLARVVLQSVGHRHARAGRRIGAQPQEPLHPPGVHRTQRVDLQKPAALILQQHTFGQHEAQLGKRAEQLVSRRRVLRVEAVEREEHRRLAHGPLVGAFRILKRRQRHAAAQPQAANRPFLRVVCELIGEPLLHQAERVDDVRLHGNGERIYLGHGTLGELEVIG